MGGCRRNPNHARLGQVTGNASLTHLELETKQAWPGWCEKGLRAPSSLAPCCLASRICEYHFLINICYLSDLTPCLIPSRGGHCDLGRFQMGRGSRVSRMTPDGERGPVPLGCQSHFSTITTPWSFGNPHIWIFGNVFDSTFYDRYKQYINPFKVSLRMLMYLHNISSHIINSN